MNMKELKSRKHAKVLMIETPERYISSEKRSKITGKSQLLYMRLRKIFFFSSIGRVLTEKCLIMQLKKTENG